MSNQRLPEKMFETTSSLSDPAKLFPFGKRYDHLMPLEIISTIVKRPYSSLSEEIFNLMYPAVVGANNFVSGLWSVFTLPVRAVISIAMIMQNIRTIDSKNALSFVGISASFLLSCFSAMIGGLLMIASTPFVAVARLVEICFPGTFGVKASDRLSSEVDFKGVERENNLLKQQVEEKSVAETSDLVLGKTVLSRQSLFSVQTSAETVGDTNLTQRQTLGLGNRP